MSRSVQIFVLSGLLAVVLASLATPALAWDGDWTQATSGEPVIFDPGNSDGVGHKKDPPQKFWIPTPRLYKDVDPEEMAEAVGKQYSPYAMARFPFNVQYREWKIPKGYYQVKPGDAHDGSPAVHLQPVNHNPNEALQMEPLSYNNLTERRPSEGLAGRAGEEEASEAEKAAPTFNTFVIKKLGRVIAVLPIEGSEPYVKKKGEKYPKEALAWVEPDPRAPILKFYYKKQVYRTRLNPSY